MMPGRTGSALVTGGGRGLGRAIAGACRMRGLAHILTSRAQLYLDDAKSIAEALDTYDPCVIINAAGWVRVDDAETNEESCFSANTTGPLRLAAAAASRGLRTVQFSSDLVFGGERDAPWMESDEPKPALMQRLLPGSSVVVTIDTRSLPAGGTHP